MLAAVHPRTATAKILLAPRQASARHEADDVVGVLIDQQGHIILQQIAFQRHETTSLWEEPVTWEDAEWR